MRDSGTGVPHEMRDAIFMDGVTTKSSVTGARRGLGLALVRRVVESRGGMISVGHDAGAVFTAVLPNGLLPSDAEGQGAAVEEGAAEKQGATEKQGAAEEQEAPASS